MPTLTATRQVLRGIEPAPEPPRKIALPSNDAPSQRGIRHPFIAIEGLDGTGKSSTARALAEMLGGQFYTTPPKPFRRLRTLVDREHAGRVEHFYFYAASLVVASKDIATLLSDVPVIADRFIANTGAYHSPYVNGQLRFLEDLPLLIPDATILLVVDEPKRIARLAERDGTAFDTWFDTAEALRRALATFRSYATFEVDTTDMGPTAVSATIVEHLRKRGILR